jgi:hypothetical protein
MAQSEAGETQSTKAKSATVLGQTLVRRETMSRAHVRESVYVYQHLGLKPCALIDV